jgi:peptidoglycan/LPS O-acetylase OafA/YrhL
MKSRILGEAPRIDRTERAFLDGYVPALDGIRGLAVLIVVVHNAAWIAGASNQIVMKGFIAITAMGWIGVSVFFALSGFLITGILIDSRGDKDYFRSFYLRRMLRIFPLYFTLLAAVVFLAAPLAWSPAWAAEVRANHWAFWFFLSNWPEAYKVGIHGLAHLWSLAVEEQFYLLWPVIALIRSRSLGYVSWAMIISGPAIRALLLAAGQPWDTTYTFTISRWDALAAGALLATTVRDPQWSAVLLAVRSKLTAGLLLSLTLMILVRRGFHEQDDPVAILGQSIVAGLSVCLLAFAIDHKPDRFVSTLQHLISHRVLRTLGKYSYAIYLLHSPIHNLLVGPLEQWVQGADDSMRIGRVLAYLALVLALSLGGALISWRLIEKPCLRLKERWAPRSRVPT